MSATNPKVEGEKLLTVADLASRWGVTVVTVYDYIKRGMPCAPTCAGGKRAGPRWAKADLPKAAKWVMVYRSANFRPAFFTDAADACTFP